MLAYQPLAGSAGARRLQVEEEPREKGGRTPGGLLSAKGKGIARRNPEWLLCTQGSKDGHKRKLILED